MQSIDLFRTPWPHVCEQADHRFEWYTQATVWASVGDGVTGVGVVGTAVTGRPMHSHGSSPDPKALHVCAPRSPFLQAHWKEAPGMQAEADDGAATKSKTSGKAFDDAVRAAAMISDYCRP